MADVLPPQDASVDVAVVNHIVVTEEREGVVESEAEAAAAKTVEVKENGEGPLAGDHESPRSEGDAIPADEAVARVETAPAQKVEEIPPKVILNQFPPAKTLPSYSQFCLKLETYLRMNKIPYENHYGFKAGKKGKLPWIEYKNDQIADSSIIIEYLNKTFDVDVDKDLSEEQKAIGRAVQVMLEENTYWTVAYHRWIDDYAEFKKFAQPPSGSGIVFSVSLKMSQRKVRSMLEQHGIGRHSRDEIYAIGCKDLKALSNLLRDKPFLLGDFPTTYDCVVFGCVAQIVMSGFESPLSKFVSEHCPNLIAFCHRVKEAFWPDWNEMVLGDKPDVSLKKGFSFRRTKKKQYKVKKEEDKATEGGQEADDNEKEVEEAPPVASTDQECAKEAVEEGEAVSQPKPDEHTDAGHHGHPANGDVAEEEKAKVEE